MSQEYRHYAILLITPNHGAYRLRVWARDHLQAERIAINRLRGAGQNEIGRYLSQYVKRIPGKNTYEDCVKMRRIS